MQTCQCSHLDIQVTIQGQIFLNMNVCFDFLVMKWDLLKTMIPMKNKDTLTILLNNNSSYINCLNNIFYRTYDANRQMTSSMKSSKSSSLKSDK